MSHIIALLKLHGVFIFSGLTAVLWYLFLFKSQPRSLVGIVFFPLAHHKSLLKVRENTDTIPIVLCYLMFVSGIGSLVSSSDPIVFLLGWCLLLLFELNVIAAYYLEPVNKRVLAIISVLILLIVIYGAVKTVQAKDFQVMNNLDFAAQIVLFIGSVIAVTRIIMRDRFAAEMDAFFVLFGLIIYSFLHSLSTIMLAFDAIQNFDFAYYTTLITLLFWLVSIPWIKRLKSRLT